MDTDVRFVLSYQEWFFIPNSRYKQLLLAREVRIGMNSKGRALDKEAAPKQLQFLYIDNLGHQSYPKVQREPFLGP
jgi:hypothetical protein